jgi:uncharacterized protein DUF2804
MASALPPVTPFPALPWRGDPARRPAGLTLPPDRMGLLRGGRPLKRWRYVGVFDRQAMLCAAHVSVGGLGQSFWAVWDRERRELRERTTKGRGGIDLRDGALTLHRSGVDVTLTLEPTGDPIEVISPHGQSYIWTRKQWATARGTVAVDGHAYALVAPALIDDSAGYHARETAWEWAAGAGQTDDGRAVGWNLVNGIHDAPSISERTVWVDGVATEVGPVRFSERLDAVTFTDGEVLRFTQEAVRERRENRIVVASTYRQPFGAVTGDLPGGLRVADGLGVMERHTARW